MCKFASFVLTVDRELWGPTDSHTDIIERHGVREDGCRGPNVLRVEILPPDSGRENLATWSYSVDQDIMPEWFVAEDCEARARAALARRAAAERWFVAESGQYVNVGYHGTATAGNGGTATAGECGTATAGDGGTATAGHRGTATAGDGGTATAGECGTATAGYRGTATAGYHGTATAGYHGTATAGNGGTATAGECGTATAGNDGTATAGECGTATAGDGGTATAGDGGTATAGECGTATAGYRGTILVSYWDGSRRRMLVGYVGEGIEPNIAYRVVDGRFVRAS